MTRKYTFKIRMGSFITFPILFFALSIEGKNRYKNSNVLIMNNCRLIIKTLFVSVLLSLTNGSYSQVAPAEPVIYAAGYGYTIQGKKVARVWKNYHTEDLGNGDVESVASSIYVVKGNVFVAGKEGKMAVIWTNGKPRYLTDGQTDSEAKSVFISGKNVYVAGYKYSRKKANNIAIVWKNDEAIYLTDGSFSAEANGIFVYKDTVYVCGFVMKRGYMEAALWKNGVSQSLPYATNSTGVNTEANSVFVYNGDVHITGYKTKNPADLRIIHWKNGIGRAFGEDHDGFLSKGNSIYVENGIVFIAGQLRTSSGGRFKATYWRNGSRYVLPDETEGTEARGIYAAGADLYMVGYKTTGNGKTTYKIWKNGVSKEMGISKYYSGGVNAVYVSR